MEILSREMLTKPPVVSDPESDDNVADESSHQQESSDNGITTPVSDLENVSNINSVTLSTSISDTPTVCASPMVARLHSSKIFFVKVLHSTVYTCRNQHVETNTSYYNYTMTYQSYALFSSCQ